jgi:ornithine cyclodeaminase/alanine dehydrogenase-like protein (mu-crystallin family)
VAEPVNIGADQVTRGLTAADAADAIEADVLAFDTDADPARWVVALRAGELLVMPCERPELGGVKLATVADASGTRSVGGAAAPSRIGGLYLMWETSSLTPVALIDGPALTALRTAALSLVATRRLAAAGGRRAVVFGTGPQGWSHLRAMAALPGVERVGVVGRRPEAAAALVGEAASLGIDAEVVDAGAVAGADIVCTATTSATPVFDGRLLREGTHVNAVGSHTPRHRELDAATMSRAAVVAVDTPAAWAAAGELVSLADVSGGGPLRFTLRQLLTGDRPQAHPPGVTVFKSVGAAYADLAVAAALYRRLVSDPDSRQERP